MMHTPRAVAFVAIFIAALAGPASAASGTAHDDAFKRLAHLEDRTEAIAEGEASGAAAREVVAAWPAVRAAFAGNKAARWSLAAVDGEIAALHAAGSDRAKLRLSANETTGALAPLFALAGDPVPVSVHLLDYLGRAVAIDVTGGDWTRAASDAANLERTWLALRPQTAERPHAATAVATADAAVAALQAAVPTHDPARVRAATARSGNAVDALERVFGG
jgi:hypothetical protein